MKRLLVLLVLLSACVTTPRVEPYPPPPTEPPVETEVVFTDRIILFPIFNSRPMRGTEVWEGTASTSTMGPIWADLRPEFVKLPIYWSHVERIQGVYAWPVQYDRDVAYLRSLGIMPVLTVKMAPAWARPPGSELCARPTSVQEYADFAADVAGRYPGPIVIEIWNEPDVAGGVDSADWYGCWGNPDEPYYGGDYYRSVLEAAYPAIKAANPEATVLAGALMIPTLRHPMAEYVQAWADSLSYDGLSFHHYVWITDTQSLDDTVNYLASLTDRPLWLTETAVTGMICDEAHERLSVDWAQIVKSEWRLGAVSWFFLQPSGWRCVDLLYPDWTPKPVYREWRPND